MNDLCRFPWPRNVQSKIGSSPRTQPAATKYVVLHPTNRMALTATTGSNASPVEYPIDAIAMDFPLLPSI